MNTSTKGFASISPERRREIARAGGIAAHKQGTAHQFTSAEASKAGKLGGLAKRKKNLTANNYLCPKIIK